MPIVDEKTGKEYKVVRPKRDYKPTAEQKKVTELLRKGYSMQAAWDEVKGRKGGAAKAKKPKSRKPKRK